jgi:transmembrane sensor
MSETTAAGIQTAAADWLLERREGPWPEDRQKAFDAWMQQSLAHRIAYWRLDAAWGRADLLSAMRRPAFQRPQAIQRKIWPHILRACAAAAVIAAIAGTTQWFETAKTAEKTYATAIGERERLTLADGSQIELNTDTSLRAEITPSERRIWLDKGEVYFEVKHNEKKPFVVMAGDHRITDIGTKFVVRRDKSAFKVAVLDGIVRLEDSAARQAPKILTKGEVAVASANKTSVTRQSPRALADAMGWQRGVLVFDHTALADVAREFNRYSTTKVVISDPKTAALTIDGTFPSNDARAFMRLAQAVLGLTVDDRGNEIVISK